MDNLISWVLRAMVILATAYLVPGFMVSGFTGALVLVLVLSLLNVLVKPILFLLTLPINILTLGLFTFVINAIVLQLAMKVVPGVGSDSFKTTLIATLVMSLLSMAVGRMIGK
ncbi:phage holin family protein [Candidatus Shapirobacteria bacterium]|nr:phage holin family protein [Candidatus Shapirobacteria bacterium]